VQANGLLRGLPGEPATSGARQQAAGRRPAAEQLPELGQHPGVGGRAGSSSRRRRRGGGVRDEHRGAVPPRRLPSSRPRTARRSPRRRRRRSVGPPALPPRRPHRDRGPSSPVRSESRSSLRPARQQVRACGSGIASTTAAAGSPSTARSGRAVRRVTCSTRGRSSRRGAARGPPRGAQAAGAAQRDRPVVVSCRQRGRSTWKVSVHSLARPASRHPCATAANRSSRAVKYDAPMSTGCGPPGSCSVRTAIRPPIRCPRSITRTATPPSCSTLAQAMPEIPAPTTTTGCSVLGTRLSSPRARPAPGRPRRRSRAGAPRSARARRSRRSPCAARPSAASARRNPWFGTCPHGTGPWPRQPERRRASRPRW
jgi:hypothetical protein